MINNQNIIETIPNACRVCFTCVRECPAKAIKVIDGQAEIIADRCILCGNCVMVCSQNAKQVQSIAGVIGTILDTSEPVVAIVAPTFAAEFDEYTLEEFVGTLKAIGFNYVVETAFGADVVAEEYRKKYENFSKDFLISTPCPAIVAYVEKFVPELVGNLAEIVSPMLATARIAKKIYGTKAQVVFIGPCIAKKAEAKFDESHSVKAVLTYKELRELFEKTGVQKTDITPQEFDPPHSLKGGLFPITRGVLQSASIDDNLIDSGVLSVDGKDNLAHFFKELAEDALEDVKFVDALCCEGCQMGPGMTTKNSATKRRSLIARYAKKRYSAKTKEEHQGDLEQCADISLQTSFHENDQRIDTPSPERIRAILNNMGKVDPLDELNCGACGYDTCIDHATAIHKGLAESEMCLPYTIDKLKKTALELSDSNVMLKETQEALQHSEKMASMGRLSAGVAHEINNPLGVILLYANLLREECGKFPSFTEDLDMIIEQTRVCQNIVSSLLDFSRKDRVQFQEVDFGNFVEKITRVIIKPADVFFIKQIPSESVVAEIDASQVTQILTNIINNAIEVLPDGGDVTFSITQEDEMAVLSISDSGPGIEESIRARVFEPFFTTKTMGQGTGLGLAVAYGIMKNHKGTIALESNSDFTKGKTGTTFVMKFPVKQEKLNN